MEGRRDFFENFVRRIFKSPSVFSVVAASDKRRELLSVLNQQKVFSVVLIETGAPSDPCNYALPVIWPSSVAQLFFLRLVARARAQSRAAREIGVETSWNSFRETISY